MNPKNWLNATELSSIKKTLQALNNDASKNKKPVIEISPKFCRLLIDVLEQAEKTERGYGNF